MLNGQQILAASFNDIVFQDRNKSYGAYLLRQDYNLHLKVAIGAMLGVCLAAFLFYFSGSSKVDHALSRQIFDIPVVELKPPPIVTPPPLPQPKAAVQQVFRTEVFTQPLIVDTEVAPGEMPPEQEILVGANIGLQKTAGEDIGNIVAPPLETRSVAPVVAPKSADTDFDDVFTSCEIPAEFPGGLSEWTRYLQKNLRYPEQAIENGKEAVVRVQFIVDREGDISEVRALNDPGDGLAEEAVRIIKKGPKWKPAEQNGRKVIFRNIQAITFRLGG